MAGPTTRLADFYTTAMYWVPLRDPADVWPDWVGLDQPSRLRGLADAYGLTDGNRALLVDFGVGHAERSCMLMRGAAEQLGGGRAADVGRGHRRCPPPAKGLADRIPPHPHDGTVLSQPAGVR